MTGMPSGLSCVLPVRMNSGCPTMSTAPICGDNDSAICTASSIEAPRATASAAAQTQQLIPKPAVPESTRRTGIGSDRAAKRAEFNVPDVAAIKLIDRIWSQPRCSSVSYAAANWPGLG